MGDLDDSPLGGKVLEHRLDIEPIASHLEILHSERPQVPQHVVYRRRVS